MTRPIVDAHMHLFTAVRDGFPRGIHDLYPADRRAEVEEYLIFADGNHVGHSVLVSLDEHDEYVAQAVNRNPDRFSAVAVMDTTASDPVADLRQRLDSMPLLGFRVWTLGANESLDVPDSFLALLAELEKIGLAAWFYSDEQQLRALETVAGRFPDLTIVLNHLGFCQSGFACDELGRPKIQTPIPPPAFQVVENLARFPNVVTLFSGHYAFSNAEYPYNDLLGLSDRLLQAFGPRRLMWASDWPWIKDQPGYRELIELVAHQLPRLQESERELVLGGNAERILGITSKDGS